MVMTLDLKTSALQPSPAVDDIAHQLAMTFEAGGDTFIRTPLMYVGGSAVVVHMAATGDGYLISDIGQGFQEAELLGAEKSYPRNARKIAYRYGISFDQHALFVPKVSPRQAVGATIAVANSSKEAVDISALRLAERRDSAATDQLLDRLSHVFSRKNVHRDAEVKGASSHAWRPTALVEHGSQRLIFNTVNANAQSVYATVSMFHDIARVSEPPERVAVANDKVSLGEFVNLLGQAGRVTDLKASDETFRKVAV
jgi:hypothetical protein